MEKDELVDKFIEENQIYSFEGDSGISNLNKICSALGYKESGFRYGSSLETFLSDNSGACDAIVDWIRDNISGIQEWVDSIESYISSDVEDDDIEDE